MNRRNFIIGIGAVTAAGGAAIGTGAFDSVEAERTVTLEVEDDASGYLGLEVIEDEPNSIEYADGQGDTLNIDINSFNDSDSGEGDGIAPDTEFIADNVFRLSNNGTNDVHVAFSPEAGNDITDNVRINKFELLDEDRNEIDTGNPLSLDSGHSEDIGVLVQTADQEAIEDVGEDVAESVQAGVTVEAREDGNF